MELIRNYTIEDIAKFRTFRQKFTNGSVSVRILSNHSIQFLEWCIAGHLSNLDIQDIHIKESFFDDLYLYSTNEDKFDILILSISYELLKTSHY